MSLFLEIFKKWLREYKMITQAHLSLKYLASVQNDK